MSSNVLVRSGVWTISFYAAYETNRAIDGAGATRVRRGPAVARGRTPARWREKKFARHLEAASSVVGGAQLTHVRPAFEDMLGRGRQAGRGGRPSTRRPSRRSCTSASRPSATLPKVLIAAPLSGHFATMLAPTVRTMLGDHDVYITDWHNARDVARKHGRFGLDEYIDHLVRFLRALGPGVHLFAVCQPCPSALMATAVLAEEDDPAQPRTLTLMSGPIDTRANPTLINKICVQPAAVGATSAASPPSRGATRAPDVPCTRASCRSAASCR